MDGPLATAIPEPASDCAWAESHATRNTKARKSATFRHLVNGYRRDRQKFGQLSRCQSTPKPRDLIGQSFRVRRVTSTRNYLQS